MIIFVWCILKRKNTTQMIPTVRNLYRRRMTTFLSQNSPTAFLSSQTFTGCWGFYTVVNMGMVQLFWDVLLPSISKKTFLKMLHVPSLHILFYMGLGGLQIIAFYADFLQRPRFFGNLDCILLLLSFQLPKLYKHYIFYCRFLK